MKQKEEKSKFSVIIPTLQSGNPDILNYLLNILNADSSVGEIILIDNSLKGYDTSKFFKVNVIIPKKNLFVNPSWNLGISLAKYDYFAILNDDLIIPKNLCEKIMEKFKKEYPGLTGLSNEINNISLPPLDFQKNDSTIETITFEILKRRSDTIYWGSAIFGKKQDYYKIPLKLKIWCGDEYLFFMNKKNDKNCYQMLVNEIYHVHSTTSNMKVWRKVKKEDVYNYKKIDKSFKIPDGYNREGKIKYFWLLFKGMLN